MANTKTSGVYFIRNRVSGKAYVGSSSNVEKRWTQHARALRAGSHSNRHLQSSWNMYGSAAFAMDAIAAPRRLALEQEMLDALGPTGLLFNQSPKVGAPPRRQPYGHHRPESIAKMRLAHARIDKRTFLGREHTAEAKEKIRRARRKTHCQKGHLKAGENLRVVSGEFICVTCRREYQRLYARARRRSRG